MHHVILDVRYAAATFPPSLYNYIISKVGVHTKNIYNIEWHFTKNIYNIEWHFTL